MDVISRSDCMIFIQITLGPPSGSVLFGQHLRLRFSVRPETRLLALRPGCSLLRAADVPIGTAALQHGAQVEPQLLHRRAAEEPVALRVASFLLDRNLRGRAPAPADRLPATPRASGACRGGQKARSRETLRRERCRVAFRQSLPLRAVAQAAGGSSIGWRAALSGGGPSSGS